MKSKKTEHYFRKLTVNWLAYLHKAKQLYKPFIIVFGHLLSIAIRNIHTPSKIMESFLSTCLYSPVNGETKKTRSVPKGRYLSTTKRSISFSLLYVLKVNQLDECAGKATERSVRVKKNCCFSPIALLTLDNAGILPTLTEPELYLASRKKNKKTTEVGNRGKNLPPSPANIDG